MTLILLVIQILQAKNLDNLTFYFKGRIMNRFSKDIGYIDDLIPQTVGDFMIVN